MFYQPPPQNTPMLNELIEKRIKSILSQQEKRRQENPENKYMEYTADSLKLKIEKGISNLPERYKNAEPDEKILEKVREALIENRGCYFYGGAGTGKTHLLYGFLKVFKISGHDCEIWNIPDQLAYFRTKYGEKGGGEEDIDYELKEKGILLIDDFGAEKQTEWNMEIMYRLINFRYENMLPTFFA